MTDWNKRQLKRIYRHSRTTPTSSVCNISFYIYVYKEDNKKSFYGVMYAIDITSSLGDPIPCFNIPYRTKQNFDNALNSFKVNNSVFDTKINQCCSKGTSCST